MTDTEFEGVLAGCRSRLRDVARLYVVDAHTAQDVVQTALKQMVEWIPIMVMGKAEAQLFAAVRNAAIDVYRSGYQKYIKVGIGVEVQENEEDEEDSGPPLHIPYEPDEGMRVDVRQAVAGLPPQQAVLALLIHVEGYTMEEVAEVLELSTMQVSRRMKVVNEQLRVLLKDYRP